jgi:hypothetical protein
MHHEGKNAKYTANGEWAKKGIDNHYSDYKMHIAGHKPPN